MEKYSNQNITAYLLGLLPKAEAERFDELSFTDDEFADALKSAENDLIDRYIHGELAGETLEKFKSDYLASSLRREKIEFAKAFQVLAERKPAEDTKPERTSAGFFSAFNIISGNKTLQWGFAAALIFLVLGGLWIFDNRQTQTEGETAIQKSPTPDLPKQIEPQNQVNTKGETGTAATDTENNLPQNTEKEPANKTSLAAVNKNAQTEKPSAMPKITIASFILAPPLRSGNQVSNFSISKETASVAVQMQLESDDYPAYQVALIDESGGANIWQSGTLRAQGKNENKTLNIQFPAKLLKSGVYSLVVSGVKAGEAEILTNYTFRAVIR